MYGTWWIGNIGRRRADLFPLLLEYILPSRRYAVLLPAGLCIDR